MYYFNKSSVKGTCMSCARYNVLSHDGVKHHVIFDVSMSYPTDILKTVQDQLDATDTAKEKVMYFFLTTTNCP